MTTQPPPESAEPAPVHVEELAAKVHESWMAAKLAAGVSSRKLETGEELLVPYDQLSEQAKELDRVTVRSVLAAQAALAEPAPVATDTQARSVSTARPLTAADLMPATPAPAGDAEVSHEQARAPDDGVPVTHDNAREFVRRLELHGSIFSRDRLVQYVAQQEARQQQAEREIAELKAELEIAWSDECDPLAKEVEELRAALQGKDKVIAELQAKLEALTEDRRVQRVRAADAEIALTEERSLTAELKRDLDFEKDCLEANRRNTRTIIEQRDELSRKLEAAERQAASLKALVLEFSAFCRDSGWHNVADELAHRAALLAPPSQPPPPKPLTESEDERIVDELMARRARGLTETKTLTPDDVRTIAREVIAEVSERACVACAADGRGDGSGYPLGRLAEAAKE